MVVPVVIVGLIAVAALIVGIINLADISSERPVAAPITTSVATPPEPSAQAASSAKARVCEVYVEVANSVKIATSAPNGTEPIAASVNARAALTAGALALSRSVTVATPPDVAKAANTLADAYSSYLLKAFQEKTQTDADRSTVDDASHTLSVLCD
ncbi:hypothetical protein [Mycolicibacterium llatzerense]|uniref:hypothetical protein n=1 Tax=Mycolicibacterium llatzerense TaxID=280871 RepID=UPI0021B5041D|nr:hypothetical protein [Mycolicibacterium llatzerense]MCT7372639.1 hypothetical protein [Mycolicibacterium llatzerense]